TDVLDRLLGDAVDRERSTAARVAVEFGEDDASEVQPGIESLRNLHGFLPRHAVGDEQNLVGLDGFLETLELGHHVVVDLEATSSIRDNNAVTRAARLVQTVARDALHVLRVAFGVDRDTKLIAQGLELIDGGRTVYVARDESRGAGFLLQLERELGCC